MEIEISIQATDDYDRRVGAVCACGRPATITASATCTYDLKGEIPDNGLTVDEGHNVPSETAELSEHFYFCDKHAHLANLNTVKKIMREMIDDV